MFIILTEEEADQVRGPTAPGHALEPLPLANGTEWALPVAVLSDPAHAMHHDFLAGLPQRAIEPGEWPAPQD